ncbi:MAG: type II toxin-antitoxin system death-on-curing family toxin [Nocardioidaceae bacterium]
MSETIYLDLDDLFVTIERTLGPGTGQVRDQGLLASALARPQATVFGEEAYSTLHAKAAALMHSLVTSHPLVDGNKRVGLVAMLLFYGLNDHRLDASDDELFDLTMAIADGTLAEVEKIAERLAMWAIRL